MTNPAIAVANIANDNYMKVTLILRLFDIYKSIIALQRKLQV